MTGNEDQLTLTQAVWEMLLPRAGQLQDVQLADGTNEDDHNAIMDLPATAFTFGSSGGFLITGLHLKSESGREYVLTIGPRSDLVKRQFPEAAAPEADLPDLDEIDATAAAITDEAINARLAHTLKKRAGSGIQIGDGNTQVNNF